MQRRDISKVLLATAAGAAALGGKRAEAQTCTAPCYARTQAEIDAGETPSHYEFEPAPVLDVRRFGWSESNNETQNGTALRAAIAVLENTTNGGGVIQLPPGTFNLIELNDIPPFVTIRGCGMTATILRNGNDGNAGALFRLGGVATGALKYAPGISDLRIQLMHKDGKAVHLIETCGATVKRIFVDSPISAPRASQGFMIDGGNVSTYFNLLENCICNHLHVGYEILAAGTGIATCSFFSNCTSYGDVATDSSSVGLRVNSGHGNGSIWTGGNLEGCQYGFDFISGCDSITVYGVRFEANTKQIRFGTNAAPQSFVGAVNLDIENLVEDNSAINWHRFIACSNNGVPSTDYAAGRMIKRAVAPGQTPLILEGFPGDTTTEQLIVRDSSGGKYFSITNQGKFARINGNAPATVTGSRGGNAALASLLTTLAAYGLIVNSTSP
jgi:hypothetical protein